MTWLFITSFIFFFQESNEDEIFKLTEELEELKIANESLQRVTTISLDLMCYVAEHHVIKHLRLTVC